MTKQHAQVSVFCEMVASENRARIEKSDLVVVELVEKVIVKKGRKWCVYSKDKTRNLGCSHTKGGALKRLREVEYFKHRGG